MTEDESAGLGGGSRAQILGGAEMPAGCDGATAVAGNEVDGNEVDGPDRSNHTDIAAADTGITEGGDRGRTLVRGGPGDHPDRRQPRHPAGGRSPTGPRRSRRHGPGQRRQRTGSRRIRGGGDPDRPDDDGVATVYACIGVVVVLVLTGLAVHLGAAGLARQRAETSADLAALAGATTVLQGPDVACADVVRVAVANGGAVDSCSVVGTDVLVMVTARVGTGVLGGTASARARAGPVDQITAPAG